MKLQNTEENLPKLPVTVAAVVMKIKWKKMYDRIIVNLCKEH